MAAAVPTVAYKEGTLAGIVVYRLFGVTTSDTVQTSTEFKKVYYWTWIPATGTSTATDSTTVTSNTTITLAPSSITVDDGWLVCYGAFIKVST